MHCPLRGQSITPVGGNASKTKFLIDCPFLHRRGYITEGYVCDVWQCIAHIFDFLHRRGYITEGYVCDVWAIDYPHRG